MLKRYSYFYFIIGFSFYIGVFFNIILEKNIRISDLFLIIASVILVLSVFIFSKIDLKLFIIIFIILNTLFFYMEYFLKVDVSLNTVVAIFQTNTQEALEQMSAISLTRWLYLLSMVFIPVILTIIFPLQALNLKNKLKSFLILLLFSLGFVFLSLITDINKITRDYDAVGIRKLYNIFNLNVNLMPANYIYNGIKYLTIISDDFNYKNIITDYNFSLKSKSLPYNIVLVIGETARAKSFSLGVYNRETNPLLSKRKNLVYFDNFYSCNTGTVVSVSCMLSYKSGQEFRKDISFSLKNEVASFTSIFDQLSFETYLATTNSYGARDPMFAHIKGVKNIYYLTYSLGYKDDALIDKLKEILDKDPNKSKLIILHTMGSHFKYSSRYPKEFEKWTPVCEGLSSKSAEMQQCPSKNLINEYDNSILFTDFVLDSLMEVLNSQNSLLIYTSDHGESLGEKNRFNHGVTYDKAPIEQVNVPGIIWFSEPWIKNFGDGFYKNALSKKTAIMNHDFIFHSMLDCAFIQSDFIDKSLSLCSPEYPKNIISSLPISSR
jgi:lipid A ethanolaminephosphotransferase